MTLPIPHEVAYVGLLFVLFVVPRVFQRWRLPGAVTCVALGAVSGMGFDLFARDGTLSLLAALGIIALFLFAGLDVDLHELRKHWRVLTEHLVVRLVLLAAVTWLARRFLDADVRAAALVALALLTPSTGFILDSLDVLGITIEERFWIRSKAIATEFLALGVMFVVLQSSSGMRLALSTGVLVAMVLGLPLVFRGFGTWIRPYAPKSEFSFVVILAAVCALSTKHLGVYYLVGAFIVGMTAQRFRQRFKTVSAEKLLHAVEALASLLVPFYFFRAGATLRSGDFSLKSVLCGLLFLVVAVPLRVGSTAIHRRLRFRESFRKSLRVAAPMLPTLVFTLVIAGILRERFAVPSYVFGGLIIYAILNTVVPTLIMRAAPPEFETPELLPIDGPDRTASERTAVHGASVADDAEARPVVAEQRRGG